MPTLAPALRAHRPAGRPVARVSAAGTERPVMERTNRRSRVLSDTDAKVTVPVPWKLESEIQMDVEDRENDVCALLVGEYEGDRFLVQEVFKKHGWKLLEARDRKRAMQCLERNPV